MRLLSKIKSGFDVNQLSSFRTPLMGGATIMIILCHAPASGVLMPQWLAYFLSLGNFGVDIFLLLSGIGLYYTLCNIQNKNYRFGLAKFYKKRFLRIFIPYLLIYIPYCIVMLSLGKYSLQDCILCLSTLEFWLYHRGAWFVSLIIVLYFFSPLLFRILDSKFRWFCALAFILGIMLVCNIHTLNTDIGKNIIFALQRVPCFILGMALGKDCQTHKHYSLAWLFILMGIFGLCELFSINSGVNWIITPIIIIIALFFIRKASYLSLINSAFEWLGKISLDSYLSNITLNNVLMTIIPAYISSCIFYGRYCEYSIVMILGIFFAYLTNKITTRILTYYHI